MAIVTLSVILPSNLTWIPKLVSSKASVLVHSISYESFIVFNMTEADAQMNYILSLLVNLTIRPILPRRSDTVL